MVDRHYPVFVFVFALFAIAIRWPAIDSGFHTDDYAQDAMLRGAYPGLPASPWNAYAFISMKPEQRDAVFRAGVVPWWAAPEARAIGFRPVSSASLALDRILAPYDGDRSLRIWHFHSLLWVGFYVLAVGLALRRLLSPALRIVTLALVSCELSLVTPVAWLANRCSLISGTFLWLSLWAYLRWRQATPADDPFRDRRAALRHSALILFFLLLALGSGEYGVSAFPFFFAYELTGATGPRDFFRRSRALLPVLTLLVIYVVAHVSAGYGSLGLSGYVSFFDLDGLTEWGELWLARYRDLYAGGLWAIPAQTLITVNALYGQGYVEIARFYARHRLAIGATLVILPLLLGAVAIRRLEPGERRGALTLILGGLLAAIPTLFAPPDQRLLIIASVGLSALIASIAVAGLRPLRRGVSSARDLAAKLPLALFALLFLAIHGPGELYIGRLALAHYVDDKARVERLITDGDLAEHDPGGRDVVVLNLYDISVGCYGGFVLETLGLPAPRTWRVLSMLGNDAIVARPTENALEITSLHEHWFSLLLSQFYRREGLVLPTGTVVERGEMRAEVLADYQGNPTRVRFTFASSLDDPRYLFAIARDGSLHRWEPIAVGARAALPAPHLPQVPRL